MIPIPPKERRVTLISDEELGFAMADLRAQAAPFDWPEHVVESFRRWIKEGSWVVHVGQEVIAIHTPSGTEKQPVQIRQFRDSNSVDGAFRANTEWPAIPPDLTSTWELATEAEATFATRGVETKV